MTELSLAEPPGGKIEPLGALHMVYLRMLLSLRKEGYDASYFPYDWRLSFEDLGKSLLQQLESEECEEIYLVAHSMGGPVSRSFLLKYWEQTKRRDIAVFVAISSPWGVACGSVTMGATRTSTKSACERPSSSIARKRTISGRFLSFIIFVHNACLSVRVAISGAAPRLLSIAAWTLDFLNKRVA